jgi:hypothetical protein
VPFESISNFTAIVFHAICGETSHIVDAFIDTVFVHHVRKHRKPVAEHNTPEVYISLSRFPSQMNAFMLLLLKTATTSPEAAIHHRCKSRRRMGDARVRRTSRRWFHRSNWRPAKRCE